MPNGVVADEDIASAVLNITPKGYGYTKIVLSADLFETADGFSYLTGSGITIDVFGADNVISKLIADDFTVKPMSISTNNTGVTATVTLDISCKYPDVYVLGMYSLPVTIDSVKPNSPEQ